MNRKIAMIAVVMLGAGVSAAQAEPDWLQEGADAARRLAAEHEYRWQQQERRRERQRAQTEQAPGTERQRQRLKAQEQARDRVSVFASNVPGRSTLSGKGPR